MGGRKSTRHAREGGHPRSCFLFLNKKKKINSWIPALAGMTLVLLLVLSPLHATEGGGGISSAIKRTGLPVPRFASLRSDEVNMRSGPGQRYPVEWVYKRKGMPVEITAEFDTWRRIRDVQGTEGWVHQATLSGKRTVLVVGKDMQPIFRKNEPDAAMRGQAEPGVLLRIQKCDEQACKVEADGVKGYIKRTNVWGIYPAEKIE
jgi:SH3-like domain-containing protein